MRIFITGIAGFIGSHLAKDFKAKGYYVRGIDNLSTGLRANLGPEFSPNVIWQEGDIRDNNTLQSMQEPFEIVIHLAAQVSGEKSFEIPIYDMETNLKGSYHVYEFARKCGARLLINFSSMSVYGNVQKKTQVTEDYYPKPISLYGNTKLAAERLFSILSQKDNFPVVHLRLFSAYGPGQNLNEMKQGIVSIFLSQLLSQDEIIVKGSLKRVRDFIYIDDVINAVNRIIIDATPYTDHYNLCTGKALSVKILIETLMQAANIKKPIITNGYTLGDIHGFAGSYKKIEKNYSWKPLITLKEGIKETINYHLNVV